MNIWENIQSGTVYFKPHGASGFQPVPVKSIHTLQLKDGRKFIANGSINRKTYLKSLEYQKLTIEQKAGYDELIKRHKRENYLLCYNTYFNPFSVYNWRLSIKGVSWWVVGKCFEEMDHLFKKYIRGVSCEPERSS